MKIYVDLVAEKYYTNRFKDVTIPVFIITDSEWMDLYNEVKVIDYVNSSTEQGLTFITNPSPKDHVSQMYIEGGKLYVCSDSGVCEIQGITVVPQ